MSSSARLVGLQSFRRGAQCAPASGHLLPFPFVGADDPYPSGLCTSSRPLLAFSQYPTPSGLRPSPPDRGSRPPPGGIGPLTGEIGLIRSLCKLQNGTLGFRLRAGRRMGMVSPCGATYFARVGKVGKAPPGNGVRKNTPCFYAASPGPPSLFTGATIKNVGNALPARERTRTHICAPIAAAQCRLNNLLLLQEATRLTSIPRGGLG